MSFSIRWKGLSLSLIFCSISPGNLFRVGKKTQSKPSLATRVASHSKLQPIRRRSPHQLRPSATTWLFTVCKRKIYLGFIPAHPTNQTQKTFNSTVLTPEEKKRDSFYCFSYFSAHLCSLPLQNASNSTKLKLCCYYRWLQNANWRQAEIFLDGSLCILHYGLTQIMQRTLHVLTYQFNFFVLWINFNTGPFGIVSLAIVAEWN